MKAKKSPVNPSANPQPEDGLSLGLQPAQDNAPQMKRAAWLPGLRGDKLLAEEEEQAGPIPGAWLH